jgi:FAD/FMN-containing dehydrogenase
VTDRSGSGLHSTASCSRSARPATTRRAAPAGARFAAARPELVVRCRSQSDVLVALEHARRIGIPVAVRGGGHCLAGRSSTDAKQVDLTGLRGITVHTGGRATLGAGHRLGHVHDALHAHGRTLAAGCGATVAIVGLTLAAASVCSAGCTG